MTRRVLNLLTALSLLLCVAACVLWVRSYGIRSVIGYQSEVSRDGWYRGFSVCSNRGRIVFSPLHSRFDRGLTRGGFHAWEDRLAPQPRPEWAGFGYQSFQGREMGWVELKVPHWAVLVAAAITPAAMVVRSVRQRRRGGGHFCPSCGYDLRATPDRCPECGAVPEVHPR